MTPAQKLFHAELIRQIRPWSKPYQRTEGHKVAVRYRAVKDGRQSAPVEMIRCILTQTNKLLNEIKVKKF